MTDTTTPQYQEMVDAIKAAIDALEEEDRDLLMEDMIMWIRPRYPHLSTFAVRNVLIREGAL